MDSITQITLGAAVGEVVLGKKVGNRAMIWGALAGTIPDLDIISTFFVDEINSLAFHRGFSHSIFFAILSAPVFGFLVHRFYSSGMDRSPWFKWGISGFFWILFLWLYSWMFVLPLIRGESVSSKGMIVMSLLGLLIGIRTFRYLRSTLSDLGKSATRKQWSWLFFWGISTHAILDCFTTYGTQLFQPLSNYRVAFNNISVADPMYTVPFLVCVITASWMTRDTKRRSLAIRMGFGLSSLYMALTIVNKFHVNSVFRDSLKNENLTYDRYMTTPSILNNVLWSCIAQKGEVYYYGAYSIFDRRPHMELEEISQNPDLLGDYDPSSPTLRILKWFTNGYFSVEEKPDGSVFFNDMRFGIINGYDKSEREENQYVFKFKLLNKPGGLKIDQIRENPENISEEFNKLWTRMMGVP